MWSLRHIHLNPSSPKHPYGLVAHAASEKKTRLVTVGCTLQCTWLTLTLINPPGPYQQAISLHQMLSYYCSRSGTINFDLLKLIITSPLTTPFLPQLPLSRSAHKKKHIETLVKIKRLLWLCWGFHGFCFLMGGHLLFHAIIHLSLCPNRIDIWLN